jgi:hypothetical protein
MLFNGNMFNQGVSMKSLKSFVAVIALALGLITAPQAIQSANADQAGVRTIKTLAAASTSTVFAETSYGAYGGYNYENGSYWYRDGYPYPSQQGWNQGGWGVSWDVGFGTYHPNNCHGNVDPNGLCFETGDPDGYHDTGYDRQWCPQGNSSYCTWSYGYNQYGYGYNPYRGYGYWYYRDVYRDNWFYGSRGVLKSGGSLGSVEYPYAYRAFFTSDEPTYYPEGIQHDVKISDIYAGGWRLCWSGRYSDNRASVSDIQNVCTGAFTIMAGSYEDPAIQRPAATTPSVSVDNNGKISASWNMHNPDALAVGNAVGKLTDLETGFESQCQASMDTYDTTQIDNTIGCTFTSSPPQHHYSLTMTFHSDLFGTLSGDTISDQLVMSTEFQAFPSQTVATVATQMPVCVYHGPSNRIVILRVGVQTINVRTDESGFGCISLLLPEKSGKLAIRAIFGKKTTNFSYVYMPSFKFSYKGGKAPYFTLESKNLPLNANVQLTTSSRTKGTSQNISRFTPLDMKPFKITNNVDVSPDTFDLAVSVNGTPHTSAVLDVTPRVAAGGIRK